MHPTPLVSIIIPTYNRAHLIEETLDSIIAQTYKNWECIVVDDGSTDNTAEVMAEYTKRDSRIQYHHRPEEHLPGGNGARNYGFKLSKGDFIKWLDSDDILNPEILLKQLNELENKKISFTFCQSIFFKNDIDDSPKLYWSKKNISQNTPLKKLLIIEDYRIQTAAFLWKRVFVSQISWNESLLAAQEWLFHIELSLANGFSKFHFSNEVLLFIRMSEDSISRDVKNCWRYAEYLKARRILIDELRKQDENKEFVKFIYQRSIRYIKILLEKNDVEPIKNYGLVLKKISFSVYLKFNFGLFFYKYTKKDFFLKSLFKNKNLRI